MNSEKLDLSRFEDLTKEREKLAALSHTLGELEEQKLRLEAEVTQIGKFNLKDQAERVLNGTYENKNFYREIEQLDNTIKAHKEAETLQSHKLDSLKRSCSKQICDEIQPDYRVIVRKMRDAAQAMLTAISIEQTFFDELKSHDVDPSYLGRVFLPKVLNKDSLQAFLQSTEERKT